MPVIDPDTAPLKTGSIYPAPYAEQMAGRSSRRLGDAAGLTGFGVNIVTLEPGAAASLRHWHQREDEFAIVLEGDLILIEDAGEIAMPVGAMAAWKAGSTNGHRFVNRTDAVARFLVVGGKDPDEVVTYSDVDLKLYLNGGSPRLTYHDGSEWTAPRDLAPQGETL